MRQLILGEGQIVRVHGNHHKHFAIQSSAVDVSMHFAAVGHFTQFFQCRFYCRFRHIAVNGMFDCIPKGCVKLWIGRSATLCAKRVSYQMWFWHTSITSEQNEPRTAKRTFRIWRANNRPLCISLLALMCFIFCHFEWPFHRWADVRKLHREIVHGDADNRKAFTRQSIRTIESMNQSIENQFKTHFHLILKFYFQLVEKIYSVFWYGVL